MEALNESFRPPQAPHQLWAHGLWVQADSIPASAPSLPHGLGWANLVTTLRLSCPIC